MNPNSIPNSRYANLQTTKQTTTSTKIPPAGYSAGPSSMFTNAQHITNKDSTFHITSNTANFKQVISPSPLDALHERAAPNAILNAGGRADEVRCDPDTRKVFLARIVKWRDAQDSRTPPILWLSGPAGAGKTAIAQTIAERCNDEGVPQANFFFFRADTSRNGLFPLVATLIHQLILLYPSLRDLVVTVLSNNPLIFDSVLENQLTQLIATPLHTIQQSSSSYVAPLLVIDGLDECVSDQKRDQRKILHAFNKVLTAHPLLFRLLVASRDESQIRATFNNISCQLLSLDLNDQDSADNDIRVFVKNEFKRLRKTHPLAHTLDTSWPSVEDVEGIVRKSWGQFIYAATVMRFVMDSPTSPTLSLARVQGAAAQLSTLTSPFSYLDAIYTYILSQASDWEVLKDIFGVQFLMEDASRERFVLGLVELLGVYNPKYTKAIVQSCLADVTPIVKYDNYGLLFHHGSFLDYLLDRSRSGEYFVDVDAFTVEILPAMWTGLKLSKSDDLTAIAYYGLCRLSQFPPGFLKILTTLDPSLFDRFFHRYSQSEKIFQCVFKLCTCQDDVTQYKQILRRWIYTQDLDSRFVEKLRTVDSKWLPYGDRYFAMAYVDRHRTTEPSYVGIAMHPETHSDARETAFWLKDLLHSIHRDKYHNNIQEYVRLLRNWIIWAVENDIPLVGVGDLPNARGYLLRGRIEKWVGRHLKLGRYARS